MIDRRSGAPPPGLLHLHTWRGSNVKASPGMAHRSSAPRVLARRWVLLAAWLTACPACASAKSGAGIRTWARFNKLPYPGDKAFLHGTFPPGFMWAVGTAAYQVEGAFDKDGKGPSIWDTFTRDGNRMATGDVGSDSYHNAAADVRAIRQLGVSHYRFSLSWPRIFPNGTRGSLNEAGVRYYRGLLARLKEARVEPVVTLYHWDLPDALQQRLGGWTNPDMVEVFRDYADYCFRAFGDDVRWWITIDNPFVVARHGYGTGVVAPGVKGDPDLPFRVGHVLLKAHAAAWHTYDRNYRRRQGGRVSMALASHWVRPRRMRAESLRECQCSLEHVLGWFAGPLFGDGDYPACMKARLGARLPALGDEERRHLRGTADFFALSHGATLSFQLVNDSLKFGQQEELDLRMLLYWVSAEYNWPDIFVVQSGWFVSSSTKTQDPKHMYYLKRFIAEALKSIAVDGVKVVGYTAWSLMDGFEWHRECGIRRGLYYVDFNTPDMKREPKTSATFYKNVIQRNGFPELPENRPAQGVFPCDFAWGVSANSIQVESSPSQFADPNVYVWNMDNGELTRLEGQVAPPTHRNAHCADYVSIRQQVDEIQAVGVSHFHFSLNWSALVPAGDVARPNATLLGYYRCFSHQLLRANVTPVVTLWHHTRQGSSLPAPLDSPNRWLNRETPDFFADYARLCFRELGEHVKMWITLNEPNDEMVSYQEAHQMLRAHALAWRAYDREFRPSQGGQVSLALHMDWVEPAFSFSREDVEPAKRVLDFRVGWFAEPIFGSGDYPLGMRSWLRQLNSLELPVFNKDDRQLVKGTYDFFAISHFSTELVTHAKEDPYTYMSELEVQHMVDTTWIKSPRPVVPWGLRKALNWVKEHYPRVPVYVMANGVQEDPARFKDSLRVFYVYNYINEALKAFTLDGVNLKGYFAYALSDQRDPGFGLYGHVHEEAVVKASLANYRNIIRHNGFPVQGAPAQRCPLAARPCPGCQALAKRPVVGFLTLLGSATLITLALVVYYASRRHKDAY
ncbi:klotho isoform X1 [Hippocampus comes]|uniref:klotho isoform X1 n=1 Tax=Hippocampus comes TaxID=109280 RepID=UPI00094E553E|nr:PREDICTED: klotho isoform X1 [Hippocampus comes]